MSDHKYKINDVLKIIKSGSGVSSECIGREVTVTFLGEDYMTGNPGYIFSPPLGNCAKNIVVGETTFEFVRSKYPNPPHKHCELIKAWADGAEIEYYNQRYWVAPDKESPVFNENTEYRIKPQKSEKDIEIERIESEMRKLADDLAKVKGS